MTTKNDLSFYEWHAALCITILERLGIPEEFSRHDYEAGEHYEDVAEAIYNEVLTNGERDD